MHYLEKHRRILVIVVIFCVLFALRSNQKERETEGLKNTNQACLQDGNNAASLDFVAPGKINHDDGRQLSNSMILFMILFTFVAAGSFWAGCVFMSNLRRRKDKETGRIMHSEYLRCLREVQAGQPAEFNGEKV